MTISQATTAPDDIVEPGAYSFNTTLTVMGRRFTALGHVMVQPSESFGDVVTGAVAQIGLDPASTVVEAFELTVDGVR